MKTVIWKLEGHPVKQVKGKGVDYFVRSLLLSAQRLGSGLASVHYTRGKHHVHVRKMDNATTLCRRALGRLLRVLRAEPG